ncbi:endonuclease [Olivibacter domesticus]|uniref:Serine protease n=1 Tax=Olivibacter domesticus TaxID=407022 RepID=A0A1H7QZQ4_OLID1|nr:endonuclease [Olivibacter domesticus]SEL53511.1 Endonuclease I [Olivibacter domesticus]
MKISMQFIKQIELVKQRSVNKTVFGEPPLPQMKVSTDNRVVVPRQMNRYLQQNDLTLNQFINDRLLRERVIKGDDILDVNYLEMGVVAGRSVCRITIASPDGEEGYGTGFLIAPFIVITNNHVLPNADYGRLSYAAFDYEKGTNGLPKQVKYFRFDCSRLFYTNEELDYSIIALESITADGLHNISEFAFLTLNPNLGKTKEGNYVSIIQHPDGKMKKVALRENQVTNLDMPKFIRYMTDTKQGTSGAPVFNDKWEVVALHHAGIPKYNPDGKILNIDGLPWDKSQGELQIDWVENEGVRVSSIIYDITTQAATSFPFLLDHFSPISDVEVIEKSMGISRTKLGNEIYYPEASDHQDISRYYKDISVIENVTVDVLHQLLKDTHTSHHNYNPSKYVYPKIDLHPDGLLRSIYSGKEFTAQELMLADERVDAERRLKFVEIEKTGKEMEREAYNLEIDKLEAMFPYNCEHVVCQSWFNKQEPMRGDLHHLFACESGCNSFRNNYPYFDFENYDPDPLEPVEKVRNECGNMENKLFEPERNKGVVARAVLYFFVRYPKTIQVYKQRDMDMLKEWAQKEPISLYEKHRNREIFLMQGNRNPFIDFPSLCGSLNFSDAI